MSTYLGSTEWIGSCEESCSKSTSTIVIAISEQERGDFFTCDVRQFLQRHDVLFVEPPTDTQAWHDLLLVIQPEVLVTGWSTPTLPDSLIGRLQLRYLCHTCGSVRNVVSRAWLEQGLLVSNWGEVVAPVVAECALMMIIAGLRGVGSSQLTLHRDGGWRNEATKPRTIIGKRIGMHGFGAIARALVRMLAPFGVTISAYDPPLPQPFFSELGVSRVAGLNELFTQSDVLVELAPLTPSTRGLVGKGLLSCLPDGALFVNVGRGAVVDEEALADEAWAGRLHLALDVYVQEPLAPGSRLRNAPNTLLLPHIAGPTADFRHHCGWFAVANIRQYLEGKMPDARITPEIYDRAT
jgi:phosphoglycerate dehydrogenase-like enzyme